MSNAYIALENGETIRGRCKSPGKVNGEIVFTTAYTGYEESLTDPSYKKQVLTFSYTLIGNYGVRNERFESNSIQPEATIARELTDDVGRWFDRTNKPAIDHVETRGIVSLIRERGAMKCGIAAGEDVTADDAMSELNKCVGMSERESINHTAAPSEKTVYGGKVTGDEPHVALIDCGAKQSIISSLTERGAVVERVPCTDITTEEIRDGSYDILFISNGPGDPEHFTNTEHIVREFIGELPVAGICLGQQIIAQAVDGETSKMEFGHRGVNQPVMDVDTKQVVMTTQNHGYTVTDAGELNITHRNVNDETIEGIGSDELDVITRQYHPEANPGPHDSLGFFDEVVDLAN